MKNTNNVIKIATGQDDDCTAGCLLHFVYFKHYYKLIAIDLNKQQALDADPEAIKDISFKYITFTWSLNWAGNMTIFFIIEEAKETVLDFS